MLLVIDVGNTNTKVGVCDDTRLLVSWSLTTRREQTADEYGLFVEMLLRTRGVDTRDITGIAISNVVPRRSGHSTTWPTSTSGRRRSRWTRAWRPFPSPWTTRARSAPTGSWPRWRPSPSTARP